MLKFKCDKCHQVKTEIIHSVILVYDQVHTGKRVSVTAGAIELCGECFGGNFEIVVGAVMEARPLKTVRRG